MAKREKLRSHNSAGLIKYKKSSSNWVLRPSIMTYQTIQEDSQLTTEDILESQSTSSNRKPHDSKRCPFCNEATVIGLNSQRLFDHNRIHVHCWNCSRDWCFDCEVPWHEGQSCMEYKTQNVGSESAHSPLKASKSQSMKLQHGECQVCYEPKLVWVSPCCEVNFCLLCLDAYLSVKVEEGIVDIKCPQFTCKEFVDPALIKRVVVSDKSKRLSFLRVKKGRYVNRIACPLCDEVLAIPDAVYKFCEDQRRIACPECLRDICISCLVPWHKSVTCAERNTSREGMTEMKEWAKKKQKNIYGKNAQSCPKCKTWIQRIDGCHEMDCTVCHSRFCYTCGSFLPHKSSNGCPKEECVLL